MSPKSERVYTKMNKKEIAAFMGLSYSTLNRKVKKHIHPDIQRKLKDNGYTMMEENVKYVVETIERKESVIELEELEDAA